MTAVLLAITSLSVKYGAFVVRINRLLVNGISPCNQCKFNSKYQVWNSLDSLA